VNKAASLAKAASAGAKGTPKAYDSQRQGGAPQLLTTPKGYNAAADVVKPSNGVGEEDEEAAKAARKAAKKAKREREAAQAAEEDGEERPQKKKKKAAAADE
jgi:hypothetical protein